MFLYMEWFCTSEDEREIERKENGWLLMEYRNYRQLWAKIVL